MPLLYRATLLRAKRTPTGLLGDLPMLVGLGDGNGCRRSAASPVDGSPILALRVFHAAGYDKDERTADDRAVPR